jgi:hypothetical protein
MPFGLIVQQYFRQRSIRYLKAHECLVCLTCRYPLSGVQSPGVCPECGAPFNTSATIIGWRRTYPDLRGWPMSGSTSRASMKPQAPGPN